SPSPPAWTPTPRDAALGAGAVGIAGDRLLRPAGRHRGEPTACPTVSEVAGERGGAWTPPSLPPAAGPPGRRSPPAEPYGRDCLCTLPVALRGSPSSTRISCGCSCTGSRAGRVR